MFDENIEPIIYESLSSDDYLHTPYWKATLSDGRTAYGKHNSKAWLELRSYLQENPDIYITALHFGFRDNVECVHSGEADYFFMHSIVYDNSGWTQSHFIGGWREGGVVKTRKYIVPEIYMVEEDERSLGDPSVIRGLIKRVKTDLSEQVHGPKGHGCTIPHG